MPVGYEFNELEPNKLEPNKLEPNKLTPNELTTYPENISLDGCFALQAPLSPIEKPEKFGQECFTPKRKDGAVI